MRACPASDRSLLLETTAEAFLLKNAAKIIQQSDEYSVAVAEALIQKTLHASTHTREVKGWDCSQVMLGLPNFKVNDSIILNRMLKAWAKAKKKLTWQPDEGPCPGSATPKFILSILKATKTVDDEEGRILLKAFRQAKIKNTNQITTTTGEEETLREYCRRNQWENGVDAVNQAMEKPPKDTKENTQELNQKWETQDTTAVWSKRWTALWKGSTVNRTKVRFWRYLRKGFFTNSKVRTWGLDTGICSREEIEAMLHKTHLSDRLQTIWAQAWHTADYWEEQTRRWLAGATKREPRSQHRSPSPQASPDREANNTTDPPFQASTGWNDNEMIRWNARENSQCNEAPTMGPTNAIRREPSPDRMAEWSVLDKTDLARRLTSALHTWTFHPTSSAHITSGTNQQPSSELPETRTRDDWGTFDSLQDLLVELFHITYSDRVRQAIPNYWLSFSSAGKYVFCRTVL
ncbi:hypothetical protein R1sor_002879 [Riccia sorocarpa]|uniref:Uncharacterized protein n=1 Tax=Riccia sorocarpa TaxID=122646 RepID=A0ABD3H020_9MARC